MIHWFGQCQPRSSEYTGFETLSEGVHSHCSVEASPVSSASGPPQLNPGTATTAVVSAFSVVYTMSETLSAEAISHLPQFSVSSPPAPILSRSRLFFAHDHADFRVRRPPPHKYCFPTPALPSLPVAVCSPSFKHFRRPTHVQRPRTTHPNTDRRHPPTATDGPPPCRRHTRRERRLRPPAGAAASDWGGGDGWGGATGGVAASSGGGASGGSRSQRRERWQQRRWRPACRVVAASHNIPKHPWRACQSALAILFQREWAGVAWGGRDSEEGGPRQTFRQLRK